MGKIHINSGILRLADLGPPEGLIAAWLTINAKIFNLAKSVNPVDVVYQLQVVIG